MARRFLFVAGGRAVRAAKGVTKVARLSHRRHGEIQCANRQYRVLHDIVQVAVVRKR
jgi:hypothetical protein